MSRGKRTSLETKETVRAMCATNVPVSEIALKTGVSERTIYDWMKKDFNVDDEFAEVRKKNKEKIIDNSWKVVNSAVDVIKRKINRALVAEKAANEVINKLLKGEELDEAELTSAKLKLELASSVTLGDVTRSYGVMIDKINLLSGEPTQNVNVTGLKFEDM